MEGQVEINETDSPAYFGEWIKRRRKGLDLTQAELADNAACSLPGLRKIEAGERRPSKQLAELLAKALGIPAEDQPAFIRVARGELNVDRLGDPVNVRSAGSAAAPRPAASRVNLPFEPTPFIGRETELQALGKLLSEPQCRLLTITGMGGIGKTRLAVELAHQQQASFPGGVYFVSLASISSPEYIVPAIAEVLRLTFSGSLEPRHQMVNYLKINATQPTLLLLDNLEHLLARPGQVNAAEDASSLLAEILLKAPEVKILSTCRERVNIQGEWIFDVFGMPFPAHDQSFNFQDYSASALFVQRARQVKADFAVLPAEQPALARVCELTEGSPLAIELAASWVGMLSLDEIAREIATNLDFLTSSLRDIPERHRSMSVVFDQSWKMLSAGEQQVLDRLAVFQGGFSRQAAEQVAGATLPVLSTLSSRTLLRRTPAGRYDMHELVRQYSTARLAANRQDYEQARKVHFDFFLALAETAGQELRGGSQQEWLGRLELDYGNLRAALEWALESAATSKGGDESALQLSGALRWFWRMRGHFHEGRDFLIKALQRYPAKPTPARARALLGLSILHNALGDLATALQSAEESAAVFEELGDKQHLAEALLIAGLTLVWHREADAGCARMEQALAMYRTEGSPWDVAHALYRLGSYISDFRGDPTGRLMLEESAAILENLGEKVLYVSVQTSLAILDLGLGEYATARERLELGLAGAREIQHPWGIADALSNLGGICRIQGEYTAARSYLEEALRVYQDHGYTVWETDVHCALAELAISQADFPAARLHLQAVSSLVESSGHKWLQLLGGYFQGLLKYYEGDLEGAATLLEATIALDRESMYKPDLARALVSLGRTRLALGEMDAAVEALVNGLEQFRQLGHKLGIATALEGLAAASAAQGNPGKAVLLLAAAHTLRAAIGAPLPPVDQPAYEALLAACRQVLGEAGYEKAWVRGTEKPLSDFI